MDTGSQNETDGGAQTETSSAASGRESHNVLLRVECISGRSIKANALGPSECVQRKRWPPDKQPRTGLQSFLIIQFFLRWIAVGIWLLFAILAFHRSFYYARERTNLHLATGVSAPFLVMACWALFSLASRVLKVCRAKQIWTKQRRRLVGISLVQLTSLAGAGLMFLASSAVASKHHCNTVQSFCIWSYFLQWTCFNMIICSQVMLTHFACVWTDSRGIAQRRLLAHLLPCMRKLPKNKLILEAPWLVHSPKLILWAIAQATIVMQLVVSLQGQIYVGQPSCADPVVPCAYIKTNFVAIIMRVIVYGIFTIWHFVLLIQGMRDVARMPISQFRMGRMLIRMVCSRDFGLGSNIVPYITLIMASLTQGCASCQPNYTLLGLIMQCSILMSMSSLLVHPLSRSTDADITIQTWLQRFAWTEKNFESCVRARNQLPLDRLLVSKEPMFCFETAVKLLYWCGFVYEYQEERVKQSTEEVAMSLYDLEHLEMLRDPLTNTKSVVAWGKDTCVVAFRGTANKQNAVHDFKAWLVPHDPESAASTGCGLGTIAAVHSGFSTSWQSGLKEAVCGILHKAVKHSCQDASKMRLLVTGHSLGGVMAVLAAFDIADLFPWQSVQVYTVGAPRPGNRAFAAQYQAKVPATWHIINPKDPVPKVGKFWALYSRPGQRVLVDVMGDMQVRPTPLDMRLSSTNPFRQVIDDIPFVTYLISLVRGVKAHMLASYRTSFVNTLKTELKQPRFEEGLEGMLELANSISLNQLLQAADLDISADKQAASQAEAAMQAAGTLVIDAASAAV